MNRILFVAIAVGALVASFSDHADARHRLFHRNECCKCPQTCNTDGESDLFGSKQMRGSKGFWPFTDGETPDPLPEPTPAPEPLPTPDGPPNVDPVVPPPDVPVVPDPTPLPPEPPAPVPTSILPTDQAELNTFISKKLGGYSKANTTRNGCPVDIWQSRGKQRIAWAVERNDCWRTAVIEALIAKSAGGDATIGGVILICHCPNDPTPAPEPAPTPAPEPLPAPEPTPMQKRLVKFGGEELCTAEAVCRAAGLWLVVVHDKTGELHRVIYGNVIPKPVAKWKAPAKKK